MTRMRKKALLTAAGVLVLVFVTVLCLPDSPTIPVRGATAADWNHATFWHHPWGRSGVHKGIDIFANEGTDVIAATPGLVIFAGEISRGGNSVAVLGTRWRVHYYAHLHTIETSAGSWVGRGERIGTVGATGNAAGKPPHLHYAILTLVPYPWRISTEPQGVRRMFYLNPHEQLTP